MIVPVAQLDRAPDYESGGWEFESLRARHAFIRKVSFTNKSGELEMIYDSKQLIDSPREQPCIIVFVNGIQYKALFYLLQS
jgi:hypothetical protein